MKKCLIVLIALLNFGLGEVGAQDYDNPGIYSDYIGSQQENITKKFLSYNSAMARGKNAKKIDKQRIKLLEEVQESKMNINAMPSCKGYKDYRDSAVSFLKLYYSILNEDYSKIINMEEIAEQSYDLMEAYILAQEKIDEKLQQANIIMSTEHKKFAAKFGMTLSENDGDLNKMMKEVSAINKYHHQAYLIFFKSFNQEKYLVEALGKGNLNAIEQNKSALTGTATEGLDKLKALGNFQGDNSLIGSLKTLLQFYIKEAEEKIPGMVDFYLKKEKFELLKKEMGKKSEKSKEDIDNYNKAVNDINVASGSYNTINNYLNSNRNTLINEWNNTSSAFLSQHTPTYK